MEITVAIPTYKNNGSTIGKLLEALQNQSYKNFRLLVVYKPSDGDVTEDVISKYKNLDIEVIYQKEGYIEEAMNLIFSNANADILITTDDDAIPSKDWVKDHIEMHSNPEFGVVGNNSTVRLINFSLLERSYAKLFEKPIDKAMSDYAIYIAETGLWTYNKSFRKNGRIIKTLGLSGYNMSLKKEVYKNFKLEQMTLRGAYYENYVGVNAIRKGFHSVFVQNCCKTEHLNRESISRSKNPSVIKELYAESVLSAYYFSRIYKINLEKLKTDILIKTWKWYLKDRSLLSLAAIEGLRLGLKITLDAIKKGYSGEQIRKRLLEIK
ncbi:glycosyltransferase [Acidianus brierleyi]|uniref:Glycosyltransferase 2-like domain-containing protein n=1 Tax=Acidianus brierleyi TaxID=41673 RepID=A0A2U9ID39_9CREN|nr:glycosyltransferase family 2 protein [Acidianus brierleyi]AWR93948.1 glycosyltransferase [Acidianus brierleyi]